MAGRNQHIIPQHYQRPFKKSGAKDHIWLYRRNLPEPKVVPISNAAAQRDFYSKPEKDGEISLDDLITEYEQNLSEKVRELREFQPGEVLPADVVAEVITHLVVRSSFLRGVVEDGVLAMANGVQSIANGMIDGEEISLPSHRTPSQFIGLAMEELRRRGMLELTNVDPNTVCKLLYFGVREEGADLLATAQPNLNWFLEELAHGSKDLGHSTQTKVLRDELAPAKRREVMREFHWRVQSGPEEGAILPDCVAIAFDGETWSSELLAEFDKTTIVVFPLTPSKLAVGVRNRRTTLDSSSFNENAANAAHTFFLASNRHDGLDSAHKSFGSQVRGQMDELTSDAIRKTVNELLAVEPNQADHSELGAGKAWVAEGDLPWSFRLSLYDFGDEEYARRLADRVTKVTGNYSKSVPLAGLEEIIFAVDYSAAIRSVDRGFVPSQDVSTVEAETYVGAAMPLTVLRDGKAKTVGVLRETVAEALLSSEQDVAADGEQCLTHILAHASYSNLIRNKFPSQILRPVGDRYEGHIHLHVQDVFSTYFCASQAAWTEPFLTMYQSMLLNALTVASERISALRADYRSHSDMDKLWPESARLVGELMQGTARYLGCVRCRGEASMDFEVLEQFRAHGLEKWINLFQADLQNFDERLEDWNRFEELFFVNRHFERLCFQFGLLPEPSDEADAYVHVN